MLPAVGIPIFIACSGTRGTSLSDELQRAARWVAIAALLLVALHQALEAARITGTLGGLLDPSWQQRALLSPAGFANAMRFAGLLAVVAAGFGPARRSRVLGLVGGLLVAVSFAITGHTSIDPL